MSLYIYLPPRQLAQAVTLLTCIWKVCGSNLGQDTAYPHLGFLFSPLRRGRYWESICDEANFTSLLILSN
jgi:hypothetical protein